MNIFLILAPKADLHRTIKNLITRKRTELSKADKQRKRYGVFTYSGYPSLLWEYFKTEQGK